MKLGEGQCHSFLFSHQSTGMSFFPNNFPDPQRLLGEKAGKIGVGKQFWSCGSQDKLYASMQK